MAEQRPRWMGIWGVLAAFLVAGLVWLYWSERVRPFDESEVWVVEVEGLEPPDVSVPTVSIDMTDARVSEVLAELNVQADVVLGADDATKVKAATLRVNNVPVLQAFAELARLTGSAIQVLNGALALTAGAESKLPHRITCAGPSLLVFSTAPLEHLGIDHCHWRYHCYVVTRPPPVQVCGPTFEAALEGNRGARTDSLYTVFGSIEDRPVSPLWERGGVACSGYTVGGRPSPIPFPEEIRGTVRLLFANPVECPFDLHADRGKTYRSEALEITYQGVQWTTDWTTDFFGTPPWPLDRYGGEHQDRLRKAYVWLMSGDRSRILRMEFRDANGAVIEHDTEALCYFSGSWRGLAASPPSKAKSLVFDVIANPCELVYSFESIETPNREDNVPEDAQRQ